MITYRPKNRFLRFVMDSDFSYSQILLLPTATPYQITLSAVFS